MKQEKKEEMKLNVEKKNKSIPQLIVVGLLGLIFSFQSCSMDTEKPLSERYTKIQAKVFAETQVKTRLKSPSTAEFNWNADDNIEKVNDTTFLVTGYVDSQNSFGAALRSNYSCTIVYLDKEKMVRCDNLVVE